MKLYSFQNIYMPENCILCPIFQGTPLLHFHSADRTFAQGPLLILTFGICVLLSFRKERKHIKCEAGRCTQASGGSKA